MKKTLLIAVLFLAFFTFGCTTDVTTGNIDSSDDTYPATIRGRVMTDSGELLTAGIVITYPNGDMERVNTNFLSGYTLLLYSGTYTLTYMRGYEYSTVTKTITVENYKTYVIEDVRLTKLFDVTDYGYYLGDLHQHSKYSDGADEVDQVLLSNLSNGLHFGFLSDHNSAGGLAEWTQGNRFVASYDNTNQPIYFLAMRAVEITTDYGHFQSIGVGNVFEEADINTLKGDDPEAEIIKMAEETIRSGAIAQINHPYATSTMGFNYWDITEEFETIEIWNGLYETNSNENLAAKLKWFDLLDGYIAGENAFHAATGGSDNHDISGYYTASYADTSTETGAYEDAYLRRGRYSGMPATCVHVDSFTEENVIEAIRAGHSFITNGPMIIADIDGVSYGETYDIGSSTSVNLNLNLFSRDQMQTVNFYLNGEIVKTLTIAEGVTIYQDLVELTGITENSWLVIEVLGEDTLYAITNPIFISK